ncbi:MAG: hypothetical protein CL835_04900 [Crocinitomicaceae bacterium]|nr:hypothetical protein [Crocinitomicaceae bacterium]
MMTLFPEVQDDSFATIGLDLGSDIQDAEHPSLVQDDIFSPTVSDYFTQGGTQLLAEGTPGSAWYLVSSQDNPPPNSLPFANRWFIAQITTTGDISGAINFQVISEPSDGGIFLEQIQRSIEFAGCGTFN